jgi:hypothetical protein
MEQTSYDFSFQVNPPARLVVENIRGSITVRATQENEIRIQAVLDPESGNPEHTRVDIHQEADGTVIAATRTTTLERLFGLSTQPCAVFYTILAPENCDVRLKSVSASAVLDGLKGRQRLSSVSGNLALSDLQGEIHADTVSGDITGLRLQGKLTIKTVSGEGKFGNCRLESLVTHTVSGDIDADTNLGEGPYRFDSVSGDVRLVVPAETSCEVHSSTLTGQVYIGLSATYLKQSGRLRQILVQNGGVELNFKSTSGNLAMVTAEQLERPIPHQPGFVTEEATQLDRMEVLEKIGRGELSVEDGIRLLSEINPN